MSNFIALSYELIFLLSWSVITTFLSPTCRPYQRWYPSISVRTTLWPDYTCQLQCWVVYSPYLAKYLVSPLP